MFEDRSTLRNQEYRIGKIIQVDPVNYFVQMRDRFNGLFQVSLHVLDSIAVMPQVDEVWMVKRIGVDWVLDKRVDDGTEDIALSDLSPGDRRIYTPQTLYVTSSGIDITADQINLTAGVINITSSGSTTIFSGTNVFNSSVTFNNPLTFSNCKQ